MADEAVVPCQQIHDMKRNEGKDVPEIARNLNIPLPVVRYVVKHYLYQDRPYREIEQRMREDRDENPVQYQLPLGKIPRKPQPRDPMRKYRKRWFHGTTMDNYEELASRFGSLTPQIGPWVQDAYGVSFEPEQWDELMADDKHDAVYLADWDSLSKAFGAIDAHLKMKLGRYPTMKEYQQHGLLVVIDPFEEAYKMDEHDGTARQWKDEETDFTGYRDYQPPFAAESGDIYSRENVYPFKLIHGKRLVRLYQQFKRMNEDVVRRDEMLKHRL